MNTALYLDTKFPAWERCAPRLERPARHSRLECNRGVLDLLRILHPRWVRRPGPFHSRQQHAGLDVARVDSIQGSRARRHYCRHAGGADRESDISSHAVGGAMFVSPLSACANDRFRVARLPRNPGERALPPKSLNHPRTTSSGAPCGSLLIGGGGPLFGPSLRRERVRRLIPRAAVTYQGLKLPIEAIAKAGCHGSPASARGHRRRPGIPATSRRIRCSSTVTSLSPEPTSGCRQPCRWGWAYARVSVRTVSSNAFSQT